MVRPWRRLRWPMPPPSVRPPTPVVPMIPLGVAMPTSCVARSTSPQVQPPPTRTVRASASMLMPRSEAQVDDDAVVDGAEAAAVVAAAAHGEQRVVAGGEPDGRRHVVGGRAPHDQGGAPVDHRVVDLAGVVVLGVARADQVAREAGQLALGDVCK